MDVDLSRFRETFLEEASEHLGAMEAGLLAIEESGPEPEVLNNVFRAAHSIKGASAIFGFEAIAGFTHELETLLEQLRSGRLGATREITSALFQALDALRQMFQEARDGREAEHPETADLLRQLSALQNGGAVAAGPAPQPVPAPQAPGSASYRIRFRPSEELFQFGLDPLLALRDLAELGTLDSVEADWSRLPALADLDPSRCYLGWTLRLTTEHPLADVRDVFAFLEDVAEIAIDAEPAARKEPPPAEPQRAEPQRAEHHGSIRVSTEKVDQLMDLLGELVITQSMAAQIVCEFEPSRLAQLQEAMAAMGRYTRELQERVMSVRMLPIGTTLSRLPRIVRDLALTLGKQLRLEMSGEDTELDKAVVERLGDPLVHLIRNAGDHGIEDPETRRAAGKPAEGRIQVRALHQGGSVIIEVADDGQGLNSARIREKAIARGLLQSEAELSDEEVNAFIFHAGLSTRDQASDLSGRGVGLDVVKRNVEALNGSVGVRSRPGLGTTFCIKLPLTLAILDGLTLRVGAETYILPLLAIVESVRPLAGQVKTMAGRGEVVMVRGEALPLVRLHRIFGVAGAEADPSRGLVVIVEHLGSRLAVLVDELLGQQQVVIKSLEAHFRKVEGALGATILGDGRAALILDVSGIAQLAARDAGAGALDTGALVCSR